MMKLSENYKTLKDSVGSISSSLVSKEVSSVNSLDQVADEIRKIVADKTPKIRIRVKVPNNDNYVSFYYDISSSTGTYLGDYSSGSVTVTTPDGYSDWFEGSLFDNSVAIGTLTISITLKGSYTFKSLTIECDDPKIEIPEEDNVIIGNNGGTFNLEATSVTKPTSITVIFN